MSIEEKAKAYDEAIKKAKEIKEKIVYSHLSTESCKAVSEYIDTIIPELREKPLTPFQQYLNCILRGVYYAEVPDKKVNEFILNVVRTRTDELIKLAKRHEDTDCQFRENEDERIRKALIDALKVSETIGELKFRLPYPTREECIAYLEKQKESLHIQETCKENTDSFTSEDEKIRKEIIDFLETIPASELKRIPRPISEWFSWLEKQKEHHIPWYDYQKSKEAGYTIVPNEEYEQLIKQKEQKPEDKEITLTNFEEVLNTFLFDFANSPIEDCEPKEYTKKHSAEILKAAYAELNAQLKQDIFEAQQEGRREGYEAAKAEQKPAEWSESDENIRKQLISICDEWLSGGYNARPCLNDVRWLKNLLETQKELAPAEWSEEDKKVYSRLLKHYERLTHCVTTANRHQEIREELNFLKSLRTSLM